MLACGVWRGLPERSLRACASGAWMHLSNQRCLSRATSTCSCPQATSLQTRRKLHERCALRSG